MIPYLILFLFLSFLTSVIRLSLLKGVELILLIQLIFPLFALISYPYILEQSNQELMGYLTKESVISFVSAIQTIEAVLSLVLSFSLIKGHFNHQITWWEKLFCVFPSPILLIGVFFLQAAAFYKIEGLPFLATAVFFALAISMSLFIGVLFFKRFFESWTNRAELIVFITLLQLLFSMFLPLMVGKISLTTNNLQLDLHATKVTIIAVVLGATVGFIIQKLNLKFNIWSK